MAAQTADAACQGLAARVASAAAPLRSALQGAQRSRGAVLPRAVKRDHSKAVRIPQLKGPAASAEDAIVPDNQSSTASRRLNRRLSFSRALDSSAAHAQVSGHEQEPRATACDAARGSPDELHACGATRGSAEELQACVATRCSPKELQACEATCGSSEELRACGFGNQQPRDAVAKYVCDGCGKHYIEEQYHELETICSCNHMISVVEGNLPESVATDVDRPKPAKRRRAPERAKAASSLPRTHGTQSEASQGADAHEALGMGPAQATSSASTPAGQRGRGCAKAESSDHAATSTPPHVRESALKSSSPLQRSQALAKKRDRPPRATLEKASATAAAPQRRSLQSPHILAQQIQVVEPQRKPQAPAKASKKSPTSGAPTTPQDLPRDLPKAAKRYLAMKPRARNQYLAGLSDAQQLRLAMQLSEAGVGI